MRKSRFLALLDAPLAGSCLRYGTSLVRLGYYRLEQWFQSPRASVSESDRNPAVLPAQGQAISVETALNSRCSSDGDGNQYKSHWGMFDCYAKLTQDQRLRLVSLIRVPRFTEHQIEVVLETDGLVFTSDGRVSEAEREWVMIESGMQQQSAALAAAALGIGTVLQYLEPTRPHHLVIRMRIDSMQPSYGDSYWTANSLPSRLSLSCENLPAPARDGGKPVLSAMRETVIQRETGEYATYATLGQLLWAARGRTPHYYKSRPWGMTIPTWRGRQDLCSAYVIAGERLAKYVNWRRMGPAHLLVRQGILDVGVQKIVDEIWGDYTAGVIIGVNEISDIAFWEVGYQLLNLILQAWSLDLSYKAFLPDRNHRRILAYAGATGAAAVLLLRRSRNMTW